MLVDVTTKRLLFVVILAVAMLSVAPSAHAYVTEVPVAELSAILQLRTFFADPLNPTPVEVTTVPCAACHGTSLGNEDSGPHGNYSTTSTKCATCHAVHNAPADSILLLPEATLFDTCETCHDGTGGRGVYGVIAARGQAVASDHNMADQTSIPGGDGASGGSRDSVVFSGESGVLTCADCHSPHGSDTVNPFTGDRARTEASAPSAPGEEITSNRLLRRQPTSAATAIDDYGSDWCGGCHAGRLSKTTLHNHPVDSEITQPDPASPFTYENVAYWNGGTGTLGYNNNGYVMPVPRVAAQGTHDPICQQCHEDARHVGDVVARTVDGTEVFGFADEDGLTTGNPRFQVFPHESNNYNLLLEEEDDLCLNCHKQPRG